MHQTFLDALHGKRQLKVTFFDKKEGRERVCTCAPLDFGPLRGAKEPVPHYQFWDLQGKRKPFNIAVSEENLKGLEALEATFDPAAIITWSFKPKAWSVERDWAEFS